MSAVIAFFAAIASSQLFHWIGGAIIGFAGGFWLDVILKRRNEDEGPIHHSDKAAAMAVGNDDIPISITPLPSPGYLRYSGLYPNFEETSISEGAKDPATYDPPSIGIKDVYISNTSLSKSVTLRMFLIITDKDGQVTILDNGGYGPFNRRMGRDDWVTRHAILRGAELPKFILSPVHIQPQTTIYGSIPFIISIFGSGEPIDTSILEYYANGFLAVPEHRFKFSLRITDVFSGITINIPLPSDGYRGA